MLKGNAKECSIPKSRDRVAQAECATCTGCECSGIRTAKNGRRESLVGAKEALDLLCVGATVTEQRDRLRGRGWQRGQSIETC